MSGCGEVSMPAGREIVFSCAENKFDTDRGYVCVPCRTYLALYLSGGAQCVLIVVHW